MTDAMINLKALLKKISNADLLRAMISYIAARLIGSKFDDEAAMPRDAIAIRDGRSAGRAARWRSGRRALSFPAREQCYGDDSLKRIANPPRILANSPRKERAGGLRQSRSPGSHRRRGQ